MAFATSETHRRLAWFAPFLGLSLEPDDLRRLADELETAPAAPATCSRCGRPLDDGDPEPGLFCVECRYELEEDMDL